MSRTTPIRTVFLHVTKACNLRCSYCYFAAQKPLGDELTRSELAELAPQLANLRPQKLVLTGGEPLLRPDIATLLHSLRQADPEHHVLRCLNTNGRLVTQEIARELVGLVDEIRVSLDALKERNDALRGVGSFDAAVQALESFFAAGFEPKVLVTVTSMSLPDVENLLSFLIAKKITRINLHAFRPIGRGIDHDEWLADMRLAQAAVQKVWAKHVPDRPFPPMTDEPATRFNCGAGQFLNIMPNGDVFPCHVLTNPEFLCGNVREQHLFDICRRESLLGQLAALDFSALAQHDGRVTDLAHPFSCMGSVYARTSELPIWKNALPLLGRRMAKG